MLSGPELIAICDRVASQEWLEEEAKGALASWLDPSRPPTPSALIGLRSRLRSLTGAAGAETFKSLVKLGLELARAESQNGAWDHPQARAALDDLERELDMVPEEAVRRVLADSAPPLPSVRDQAAAEIRLESRAPGIEDLAALLQRPRPEVRRKVLELLASDAFAFPHDLARAPYRERVLDAVQRLADAGLGGLAYPTGVGGQGDSGAALAAFETIALGDHSVLVKYGVQFGLFGGSILQLGTERHHQAYLAYIAALRLPGCYAMTEIGHGSNVRDLETVARYDPATGEFVVETPHAGARKDWIGNAALHGRMATVFARLIVAGEDHGVHALLVPIRDGDGRPLPEVGIEDRGAKVGLEGVDNGLLHFAGVRVPRANLLDRFATVDAQGRYASPIPSANRRFFTMLGTLVAGRISIAAASVSAAKVGLTVAVRWSSRRRQFGPSGSAEVPLMHYLAHQRRLLVPLAATYGLHFAVRNLAERYAERQRAQVAARLDPSALPMEPDGPGERPVPGDEEGRRI